MNEKILLLREQGKTFQEIANELKISKQAVNIRYRTSKGLTNDLVRPRNIFRCLKERCNNPKNRDYRLYGQRGIKCLWNNFDDFWNDMKDGYSKELTIDRQNNNGNYCKDNCRWIKKTEQQKNRRPFKEWNLKSKYWKNKPSR